MSSKWWAVPDVDEHQSVELALGLLELGLDLLGQPHLAGLGRSGRLVRLVVGQRLQRAGALHWYQWDTFCIFKIISDSFKIFQYLFGYLWSSEIVSAQNNVFFFFFFKLLFFFQLSLL